MPSSERSSSRRTYLETTAAVAAVAGLAGCFGLLSSNDRLEWTAEVASDGLLYPAVDGETVYVGGPNGVDAFETETGDREWSTDGFEVDEVRARPTVTDVAIYVGNRGREGEQSVVHAFHRDGSEYWSFRPEPEPLPVYSSPTVADGTVYVGCNDAFVYALDADEGTKRWEFETESSVTTSPAVDAETVYVGGDGVVYALDAADGTVRWTFETGRPVQWDPVVVDGTVYAAGSDGTLHAIDAGGESTWTFEVDDENASNPIVADGTVYVGSSDRTLYAVDADEGEEDWTFRGDDRISSPTLAGETVYVGSGDANLYAVDASDGTERWSYETSGPIETAPAVDDDRVYVGNLDGSLYALELR